MVNGILPVIHQIPDTPGDVPEGMLIRGEKTVLRPVTHADTDLIVAWRNDPSVRSRFLYREPFTRTTHEIWLREAVMTGLAVQFMICEDAGEPNPMRQVGSVYLRDIDGNEKKAEYGIFIGERDARGKGYASEAAGLVLAYAFGPLRLQKVGLRVFRDNAAAIASYRRAGFRTVKELKDAVATDGKTGDMYWMEAYAGACAE